MDVVQKEQNAGQCRQLRNRTKPHAKHVNTEQGKDSHRQAAPGTLLRSVLVPWLDGWTRDVSCLRLPQPLASHFRESPAPTLAPDAFWLFTDGSAGSGSAGCGVVLCVEHFLEHGSDWSFLGWSGFTCSSGSTNNDAESAAILFAATWALGVAWCVPVHVVSDSWVASQSASGQSCLIHAGKGPSVHQKARAVVQVHQLAGSALAFDWVPSHCGIAANELADAASKYFARVGNQDNRVPGSVRRLWDHPLLPWTWALFGLPGVPELGSLLSPAYEPADPVQQRHVDAIARSVAPSVPMGTPLQLRLCTANVCSLRGKYQFLQHQLSGLGVSMCALQETRAPGASALLTDGWLRFGTAGHRGHHGVALWLSQSGFVSGGHLPSLDSVVVVQQRKDWLAIRFTHGSVDFVAVSFHGRTLGTLQRPSPRGGLRLNVHLTSSDGWHLCFSLGMPMHSSVPVTAKLLEVLLLRSLIWLANSFLRSWGALIYVRSIPFLLRRIPSDLSYLWFSLYRLHLRTVKVGIGCATIGL